MSLRSEVFEKNWQTGEPQGTSPIPAMPVGAKVYIRVGPSRRRPRNRVVTITCRASSAKYFEHPGLNKAGNLNAEDN